MKNAIIFTGSGGQGVMSMGIMLAQSAVESGRHAAYMPSYGPEQRGGSAKCTVIIDKDEIVSPMAGSGGVLVAMNNGAYKKRKDIRAIGIPADALALEVGSPKVANVIVIGALIALTGLVSPEEFQLSLDRKFAKKSDAVRAMNAEALKRGIAAAKQ